MIFGIGMVVIGYAVTYWGIHHFCGVDCPGNNPCACRYSLVQLLALKGLITEGKPVQLK